MIKIIFVCFCVLTIQCKQNYKQIDEKLSEANFNYRLKDFTRYEIGKNNQKRHEIIGEDSYSFISVDEKNIFVVYNFQYISYDKNQKRRFIIKGGRGEFDTRDSWIVIDQGAEYNDAKNLVVQSKELRYDVKLETIETNTRVIIREKNIKSICEKGVTIDQRRSVKICRFPVIYSGVIEGL